MTQFTVDIEVMEPDQGQARYLAHGFDDVCWTDSLEAALEFLKKQIRDAELPVARTGETLDSVPMCPHCGVTFPPKPWPALIPTHSWPEHTRQVCPGSQQTPRNKASDRRPLWKDES